MFTEWRHDIRYKMALSSLDCVECAGWRPESGMKSQWSACMQSKSETFTVTSWMVQCGSNSIFASQCSWQLPKP